MSYSYTVSLQARHPSVDPNSIAAGIGLPAKHSWAVGENRATPKGTPLPGTYRESYCVFDLGGGDDGQLANYLRKTLGTLEHVAPFAHELRRTGGRLSFFICWSLDDGRGETFDVSLLEDMARLGIDLGIQPVA